MGTFFAHDVGSVFRLPLTLPTHRKDTRICTSTNAHLVPEVLLTLIFLANILCVHVRKSDEMSASRRWCTRAKKNATEVTVCLAFDFTALCSGAFITRGATHVVTVCSCQRNHLTSSPFFYFVLANAVHF